MDGAFEKGWYAGIGVCRKAAGGVPNNDDPCASKSLLDFFWIFLLEEIHFEIARQLLADSEMAINELAATPFYSDVSAFTRAFRRWTDMPPAALAKFRSVEGALALSERG